MSGKLDAALTPLRQQALVILDECIDVGITLDPKMRMQVQELIDIAWKDAEAGEWDEVAEKFHQASGLDEASARAMLAGKDMREPELALDLPPREDIETLIPDGWFARYLEYVADSEAPTCFHFGAALTACSAGLGRQPLLGWEARPTYPNLYTLLIGPTGARKGSALNLALDVVQPAFEMSVLPNEGTHQGYAAALKRRYDETQRWSDGLIVVPEFSVLMKKDRHKDGLVQWLTDWYDSPPYWARALRSEEQYELHNVCVSMLGASNMAWLRTLPEDAISGGYFPRHLIFDAPGRRHWKARPSFSETLRLELIYSLRGLRYSKIPAEMTFDPATERYMDHWYEVEIRNIYEGMDDDQVMAWLDRKQAAALKVATVWQLIDGGPKDALHKEWLHKARKLVDWQDHCVMKVYKSMGTTSEGEAASEVLQYIKRNKGRVPAPKIWRAMRNKYKKGRVVEALETLKRSGEITLTGNPIEGAIWEVTE